VNNHEARHRNFIEKMNASRSLTLQYYRDAEIDTSILPLVELLNNQWTLTAHSCGGHWKPKPTCPYVSFFIMDGKERAWERIWKRCRRNLAPHVSTKATLHVTETYEIPGCHRDWVMWQYLPSQGRIREVFRTEQEFRKTYDVLIGKTCWALRRAMKDEACIH